MSKEKNKKFGINSGPAGIQDVLEQVFEKVLHDFFNDPQNSHLLTEYMAERNNKKYPPLSRSPRDISNNEIIRPRDLPQATGMSRTNIWRLEKANLFVPKIKLSTGCVGYSRASISEWLSNRQMSKEA